MTNRIFEALLGLLTAYWVLAFCANHIAYWATRGSLRAKRKAVEQRSSE